AVGRNRAVHAWQGARDVPRVRGEDRLLRVLLYVGALDGAALPLRPADVAGLEGVAADRAGIPRAHLDGDRADGYGGPRPRRDLRLRDGCAEPGLCGAAVPGTRPRPPREPGVGPPEPRRNRTPAPPRPDARDAGSRGDPLIWRST